MIAVKGEIAKALDWPERKDDRSFPRRAVKIAPPEALQSLLASHLEDLRALLIVSQIELSERSAIENPYESQEIEGLAVGVIRATGNKCQRCWNYSDTVGTIASHPDLCERCQRNCHRETGNRNAPSRRPKAPD